MVLFNNLPRIGGETPIIPLPPHSRTFGENSWETISLCSSVIEQNQWTEEQIGYYFGWFVGDIKPMPMNTNPNITLRILGFNHDDRFEGSSVIGKAGISLEVGPMTHGTARMNSTNTNANGWLNATMRTSVLANMFNNVFTSNGIPRDLAAVVKRVQKRFVRPNGTISNTADNLWLLSSSEMSTVATLPAEGGRYAFYRQFGVNGMRKTNTAGTNIAWWLRTSSTVNTTSFMRFDVNGNFSSVRADTLHGISFGLCV